MLLIVCMLVLVLHLLSFFLYADVCSLCPVRVCPFSVLSVSFFLCVCLVVLVSLGMAACLMRRALCSFLLFLVVLFVLVRNYMYLYSVCFVFLFCCRNTSCRAWRVLFPAPRLACPASPLHAAMQVRCVSCLLLCCRSCVTLCCI